MIDNYGTHEDYYFNDFLHHHPLFVISVGQRLYRSESSTGSTGVVVVF